MNTVRAAVFEPGEGLLLRELSRPELNDGEILIEVLGCTICGSDLHTIDGRRDAGGPMILGHEIVGRIVELAGQARCDNTGSLLSIGDRITWAVVASCGDCFYCLRDLPQKCVRSVKYGHTPLKSGRELYGGLADLCLLAPSTAVISLPDDLPLAVACPASCATATAVAAIEAAGEVTGASVVVFGAGMLGLTTIAMLREAGANHVLAVDPANDRQSQAMQFGASSACRPTDIVGTLDETTRKFGFDIAIEMSGHSSAFESAWKHSRIGGTFVLVGSVFPAPGVPIELEQIVRRLLTIRGVHNYAPRHLQSAVDFLEINYAKYPFAECVERWFSLDQIDDAVSFTRDSGAIRVGVTGATSRTTQPS